MRLFLLLLLAILLSGCGRPQTTMIHGKPVTHWVHGLQDHDPRARKNAVEALGNVGALDSAAIPALIGALKDRDASVRVAAVLALMKIGPDAEEAIPALTEALEDRDAKVRVLAPKALERIRGGE
jgi:HEAT repeat protein